MNSGVVDRDLFEEVEEENIGLLGGVEEKKSKHRLGKRKNWWILLFKFIVMMEVQTSRQIISPFFSYLSRSRHFLRYNIREIFKRKTGYCLGMLSCVLVVLAVTTTVTVTDQLPIIFLRIGENTRGQFDIRISSDWDVGYTINYTHMEEGLRHDSVSEKHQKLYDFKSPRITFSVRFHGFESCELEEGMGLWDREEIQWAYGYGWVNDTDCVGEWGERIPCARYKCGQRQLGEVIAYDHDREKKMGFGREWNYEQLKPGECIISENLADDLEVGVGDDLIIQTSMINAMNIGWLEYSGFLEAEEEDPNIEVNWNYIWWYYPEYRYKLIFPLKIVALEKTFKGKNDHERYGNDVAYVDYQSLYYHVGNYVDQEFWNIRTRLMATSPYSFTDEIYVNHPERVTALYNTNNYRSVRKRVTSFAGQFLYLTGFDQLDPDYPLVYFLQKTRFIGLFLSLIINIIIAILVGLSVILIYSLLMINVEERTFEMGVLRMVGLRVQGLVEMIVMQSLLYSFPGILTGLLIGQLMYMILALILRRLLKASIPFIISLNSVLIAIALGVIIPLAGSIIPIRKAMGKSLNESLDTKRSKTKAIKIKIERLTDKKISWSLIILSGGSFGFGFFIYYFFPLAMITRQFELLLMLFFGIILMMLVGCVLLSLNLEGIIQNLLTRLIFCWEFASVKKLVIKNLIAHKSRNRKTTVMYSISLGFLIFISVSTRLEIKLFEFTNYRIYGTELTLDMHQWRSRIGDLNNPGFLSDLDRMVDNYDILEDYAYVSVPISNLVNYTSFRMKTIGGYWWEGTDLSGMSPNFFEVVDREYLIVSEDQKDYRGWGVAEQLYSEKGSMGFMGGKGEFKNFALSNSLNENIIYQMAKPTELFTKYTYYLMRYDSVLESGAGTTFCKYDESVIESRLDYYKRGHDGFISFPSYLKILETENIYTRVQDIPIRYIYLKISKKFGGRKKRILIKRLKSKIKKAIRNNEISASITDVNTILERIKVIDNVLTVFFYLSTVLAMTMCFFSLIANMITNVQEQSKEIGILRAVGCKKCTLRRIYVYEALVIIYTSGVIGTIIGMFIGYTLVLQQQLFTQLPLSFVVPYEIIIIVIVTGIVCGFFASICPIDLLLRSSPVMIMRKVF